jgi:hypothetical protein
MVSLTSHNPIGLTIQESKFNLWMNGNVVTVELIIMRSLKKG